MATKGLSGRAETCTNHHDRKAVARCAACHTPICKECVVTQGKSKFCSTTCAANAESFRDSYKGPAKLSKNYGHKLVQAAVYIGVLYGLLLILAFGLKMGFAQSILNFLPWHDIKIG